MASGSDRWERAALSLAKRVSERTAFAIAAVIYGGFGLAVPLLLGLSNLWLLFWNVISVSLAGTILMVRLAVIVRDANRRHLIDWTTSLRLLTSDEFEWLVGEVFRREGWTVSETGRSDGPDGNIDLDLTRGGHRAIVQCKRWTARNVGVDEIRAFGGTLLREKLPPTSGIFVTLSGFGEQARDEARTMGLTLVDHVDLHARVEKARRTEPCGECQQPMVLDRSIHGWWMRCISPGCNGKRDLGSEPGRAADLLIQGP